MPVRSVAISERRSVMAENTRLVRGLLESEGGLESISGSGDSWVDRMFCRC